VVKIASARTPAAARNGLAISLVAAPLPGAVDAAAADAVPELLVEVGLVVVPVEVGIAVDDGADVVVAAAAVVVADVVPVVVAAAVDVRLSRSARLAGTVVVRGDPE